MEGDMKKATVITLACVAISIGFFSISVWNNGEVSGLNKTIKDLEDEILKFETENNATIDQIHSDNRGMKGDLRDLKDKKEELETENFFAFEDAMSDNSRSKEKIDELSDNLIDLEKEVTCLHKAWTKSWRLAMNLNPSDGHIMDYTTGTYFCNYLILNNLKVCVCVCVVYGGEVWILESKSW